MTSLQSQIEKNNQEQTYIYKDIFPHARAQARARQCDRLKLIIVTFIYKYSNNLIESFR